LPNVQGAGRHIRVAAHRRALEDDRVPSQLRRSLGSLHRLDRTQLTPREALRVTFGVVLPLVLAVGVGRPGDGVAAAAGALSVGFASFQGVYRTRARTMVVTACGMAISTLVGGLVGGQPVLLVLLTAVWGVGAGLLTALGPPGTTVGLQCTVALIIVADFAMTPEQALGRAALVLAGGLLQTLLVVGLWPLRTRGQERRAVAAAFAALGRYAGDRAAPGTLPDAGPFADATTALSDANPLGQDHVLSRFRALLNVAERARVDIAALSRARVQLDLEGRSADVAVVDQLLAAAERVLTGVAEALSSQSLPWLPSQETTAGLTEPLRGGTALEERLPPDVAAVSRGLRGQMRAAARLVGRLDADEDALTDESAAPAARAPSIPVRGALLTLRANLNLHSESFRHAIRLAVALAVASVLFTRLSLENGYWVALTTLVVLRPDYGSTMSRGIERILGTLLGSVVATVVAAELRPGPWALVVLVGLSTLLCVATLRASYPIFAAFLTCYVVFLLSLTGLPSRTAGVHRLIDTAVGGLLAMLAYRLWPTWESTRTGRTLATLLEAQGRYGTAVLRAYADPAHRRPDALHRELVAARLARSNAQTSVDRLLTEPVSDEMPRRTALGVIAAVQMYAQSVMTLHARLPLPADPAVPQVAALAEQINTAMQDLADTLRGRRAPPTTLSLRETQTALRASLGGSHELLVTETDTMVDAVDTIHHLLTDADRNASAAPAGP
jgi:uncharacterized membrane protein YccC